MQAKTGERAGELASLLESFGMELSAGGLVITGALATTSTRRSLGNRPRANVDEANAIATTATGTRL